MSFLGYFMQNYYYFMQISKIKSDAVKVGEETQCLGGEELHVPGKVRRRKEMERHRGFTSSGSSYGLCALCMHRVNLAIQRPSAE